MMAAKRPVRYTCTIRLEEIVNLVIIKPLDVYDDVGLFQPFGSPRGRELRDVIDEFNDNLQYLASTKGSSSAFVGGRSCTCVCFIVLLSVFFCFVFLFFCFSCCILWCNL